MPNLDIPVADAGQSSLVTAISLWRAGRRISMVLAQKLMDDGYDVPSLERAYSRPIRA